MSMAHSIESRVPLLDHPLIEFVASVPADVKFKDGQMKQMLKRAYKDDIPREIHERRDKMGFPVPLKEWTQGEINDFLVDTFSSSKARSRPFMNADAIVDSVGQSGRYSRKLWGLLSLELWHQSFHDRATEFRRLGSGEIKSMAGVTA